MTKGVTSAGASAFGWRSAVALVLLEVLRPAAHHREDADGRRGQRDQDVPGKSGRKEPEHDGAVVPPPEILVGDDQEDDENDDDGLQDSTGGKVFGRSRRRLERRSSGTREVRSSAAEGARGSATVAGVAVSHAMVLAFC